MNIGLPVKVYTNVPKPQKMPAFPMPDKGIPVEPMKVPEPVRVRR